MKNITHDTLKSLTAHSLAVYDALQRIETLNADGKAILAQADALLRKAGVAFVGTPPTAQKPGAPSPESLANPHADLQQRLADLKAALYAYGKQLISQENTAEAADSVLKALQQLDAGYRDVSALRQVAANLLAIYYALNRQDWDKVREQANALLAIQPQHTRASQLLRESYLRPAKAAAQAQQWEEAFSTLKTWHKVAPPDSETQALYNQYEKSYRQAMAVLILGDLVRVAGGDFLYGDNKQRHNVPAFDIGKYPVTVEQYLAFVKATKHAADNYWNGDLSGNLKHPAVYVNVSDAEAYCRWASQITGRAVRLPSEQEWEKAARGTDGRDYPWGNVAPDHTYACFNMSATTPVGSYPKGASPYGCMDMAGNVWEWCQGGVIRGGAYSIIDYGLRCAYRDNLNPTNRYGNVGFRILASPIF